MITFLKKTKNKKQKGFTLLFAVLVSTLVVSISATVISIALRQTIISGTSRESQYAFYATNTIMECVFYWDLIGPESVEDGNIFPAPGEQRGAPADVTCGGGNIITGEGFDNPRPWDIGTEGETTIYMEIKDVSNIRSGLFINTYCAQATISKTENAGIVTTLIEAKGYNTCDLSSPRAVERGLVQSYQS